MRFFSGFLLRDEQAYFRPWLKENDLTVAGFSYGAIRAFEYVRNSPRRVDTLQLFSPAFFLGRDRGFKRMQLRGFKRDSSAYRQRFLASCFSPYPVQEVPAAADTEADLEKLLDYAWPAAELDALCARGTALEVYVGEKDAVIDAAAAAAYFKPWATTFFLRDANHFLQGEPL